MRLRRYVAAAVLVVVPAGSALAQDVVVRGLEESEGRLNWTAWVSDVPTADLTGTWIFDAERSDPMVEVWREREVRYEINQQFDRIVVAFRPEGGEANVQTYRWDGSVNSFQRQDTEVRERARWIGQGRVLEVEGRWWPITDRDAVTAYRYEYRVGMDRTLSVRLIDEYGETTWRFRR
jgi:hypothetical protein